MALAMLFASLKNGCVEIVAVACSARALKGLIRKPARQNR